MTKKFVFPDTSIFVHFRSLEQIDLVELLQGDSVELVVSPAVLDELDRQGWNHPRLVIRKRAEHGLKRIRSWMDMSDGLIRPGVEMTLCQSPREATFREHQLDPQSQDDLIIANVLEYSEVHGKHSVLLLTHDVRRQLKAHRLHLQSMSLPTELMLPTVVEEPAVDSPDRHGEIVAYQSREPRLEMRFENGSRMLEVMAREEEPLVAELVAERLEELRARCQIPLRFRDTNAIADIDDREAFSMLVNAALIPEEEFVRYARELDTFLTVCEEWLGRRAEVMNRIHHTVRLDFELVNSGSAVATGLVLTLSLPKKLRWRQSLGEDEISEEPRPPHPPRSYMELVRESITELYSTTVPPLSAGLEPVVGLTAEAWSVDGQDLRGLIDECLHHHTVRLPPIYATFVEPDAVSSFAISYVINQRTVVEPVDGKLLVRVA